MPHVSCVILLVLCATQSQSGKVIRVTTTGDQSKSVYLNDKGVEVIGHKTLIMDIKACAEAVIQFAPTQQLNGGFFEVYLGSRDNSMSMMRFSGKKKKESVRGSPLDCKAFRTFWFSWEDEGTLRVGSGSIIGVREFLSLEVEEKVEIHYIIVYTAMGNEGEWNVLKDSRPEFVHPNRDGSTVIEVREDTPAHAAIYELKAHDPDEDEVTYHVIGQHDDIFGVSGIHLKILKRLDFETKENFVVTISASDGKHEVRQSMMVMVVDLVDEVPVIGPPIMNTILEELPVGTPIGQLATVVDRDRGAKLKYSLRGRDSQYFNMDPNTGEVRMRKRLDRDRRNGRRVLDQLILTVDDHIHLQEKKLRIGVIDINDNPPMFGSSIYRVAVKENMLKDTVIANLSCVDIDDAANSIFSLVVSSVDIHKSPRKATKKDVNKDSATGADGGSEKNASSMTPPFGGIDKSPTTGNTNSETKPAGPVSGPSDERRGSSTKGRDEVNGKADDELGDIMDQLFDSTNDGQGRRRGNRRSIPGSLFDDDNDRRDEFHHSVRNPSHIDGQDIVGRNARSTNYQQPRATVYPDIDTRYNRNPATHNQYPSASRNQYPSANRYDVKRDDQRTPYSHYSTYYRDNASDRKERPKHDNNDWDERAINRYSDQLDPFSNDPRKPVTNDRNYKTQADTSYDRHSYDRQKYGSRRSNEYIEEEKPRGKDNRSERSRNYGFERNHKDREENMRRSRVDRSDKRSKYGFERNYDDNEEDRRHSNEDRRERRRSLRRRRFKDYDNYDYDYGDRYGTFQRPWFQPRRNYRRHRADNTGEISGSTWMHDQRYGYRRRRPKEVPVPDNWGDLLENNEPYLGPRHEEPPKRLDDILQPVKPSEDLPDVIPTTRKPKPLIPARDESLPHNNMPNIITKADQEKIKHKLEITTQRLIDTSSEITTIIQADKPTSDGTLMSAAHSADIGDYDNDIDLGQLENMTNNNRNQLDGIMDGSDQERTTVKTFKSSTPLVTSSTSSSNDPDSEEDDFESIQKPDVESLLGDYDDPFGDDSDAITETPSVSATTLVQDILKGNNNTDPIDKFGENGDDSDFGDLSDVDDNIDDDSNDLEDIDGDDDIDDGDDDIDDFEDLDEDGENLDPDDGDDDDGLEEDNNNGDIDLDNDNSDDELDLDYGNDDGNLDLDDDKDDDDLDLEDDKADGDLDLDDNEGDLFENENTGISNGTSELDESDNTDNFDDFDYKSDDDSVGTGDIDINNNILTDTYDSGNKSGTVNKSNNTGDKNGDQDYSSDSSSNTASFSNDKDKTPDTNDEDEFTKAFSTEYNDYDTLDENNSNSADDSFPSKNDALGFARRKRSTLEEVLGQEFRTYLEKRKKQRQVKAALKAVGRLLSISRKQRKRRRKKWMKLISKFFKTLDKGEGNELPMKAVTLPTQRYKPFDSHGHQRYFRNEVEENHPDRSNELPLAFLPYRDVSRGRESRPRAPTRHQSKYGRPEDRYLQSSTKHLSREDSAIPFPEFDRQNGFSYHDKHFPPGDMWSNELQGFKTVNSNGPRKVSFDMNNYGHRLRNKPQTYDQSFYGKSPSFMPGNWGFQPSKYHSIQQTSYEPDHSSIDHAQNPKPLPLYYDKEPEFPSYPYNQIVGQQPTSIHMPPYYQTKGFHQPWRSSEEHYLPRMTDNKHHNEDTYEGSVNQNDIELEHTSFESPDYDSDGVGKQGISTGRARVYEQLGLKPPESVAGYDYQEPVSSKWNGYDSQETVSRPEVEYDMNNNRGSNHPKFHEPDYKNVLNEHPLSKQDRYNIFINGELGRDPVKVNPPSLHSVKTDHDNQATGVDDHQGNDNTDANRDTMDMQNYVSPPLSSLLKLHIDTDSNSDKVPMNDYVLVPKSVVKHNLESGNIDKETEIPVKMEEQNQNIFRNVGMNKRDKEYTPIKRGGKVSNTMYNTEKTPKKPHQDKFIEQLMSLMKDEKMMDLSPESHFPPFSSYQTDSSHKSTVKKRDPRGFYKYPPMENTRDVSMKNTEAPNFSNPESDTQYKSEESFKANLRNALEAAFNRDSSDQDNQDGQQASYNFKAWENTVPEARTPYRLRHPNDHISPLATFPRTAAQTSAFVDEFTSPFTSPMKDKKHYRSYAPVLSTSQKTAFSINHPIVSESRKRVKNHNSDGIYSNLRNLPKRDTAQVTKPMFEARGLSIVANSKTVDYDSMGEGDHTFTLTVLAKDKPEYGSPLTGTTMVLVEVIPVNEFTPEWVNPSVNATGWFPSVLVPENVTVGTNIITISASDEDGGDDGRITYTLTEVTAANGEDAREFFTIEPSTGILKTAAMLDRDPQTGGVTHLDLVITASDNGDPAFSTKANMRVSLADINDNRPVFGKPLYESILPTTWAKLSAWKMQLDVKDHDRKAVFKFKFVKGETQKFLLDENTGTLSLSGTPDRTLPYKVLTVMVSDGGSPELNSTTQVIIHTQKYSFEQVKAAIDAKTKTEGPWVFKMLSGVFGFVLLFILIIYVCKKYGMFSSVVGPNGERIDDDISVHEGNRSRVINIAPPPDVTNRADNSGIEQSVEEGQEGHPQESITSVRKGHRY